MQTSEKLFLQTVGRFIAERFKLWITPRDERITALERRVGELEARPEVKYRYAFVEGKEYHEANLVTFNGALWVAKRTTTARPGAGDESDSWKLVVKSGQAVDWPRSDKRLPTSGRRQPA